MRILNILRMAFINIRCINRIFWKVTAMNKETLPRRPFCISRVVKWNPVIGCLQRQPSKSWNIFQLCSQSAARCCIASHSKTRRLLWKLKRYGTARHGAKSGVMTPLIHSKVDLDDAAPQQRKLTFGLKAIHSMIEWHLSRVYGGLSTLTHSTVHIGRKKNSPALYPLLLI